MHTTLRANQVPELFASKADIFFDFSAKTEGSICEQIAYIERASIQLHFNTPATEEHARPLIFKFDGNQISLSYPPVR